MTADPFADRIARVVAVVIERARGTQPLTPALSQRERG
jgi:hypothetical protein